MVKKTSNRKLNYWNMTQTDPPKKRKVEEYIEKINIAFNFTHDFSKLS